MPIILLIAEIMPIILGIFCLIAILFHPIPGARAMIFFGFGYFSTTILYYLGYAPDYGQHFHPLIIASAFTILLYHSLDITVPLFIAWIIELILIALNASMVWQIGLTPMQHWSVTILLNFLELMVLSVNWWVHSERIVYRRFFDLDQPLAIFSREYTIVDHETHQGKEEERGRK